MPNILTIPVPNPDQLLNAGAYGAGAVVQVQRAAASSGPFDDEGTVPIIAGTTSYIYYDTEGSTATWYRVRYESADGTTAVSEWGTPFQSYTSLVSLADARSRAGAAVTQAMIDGLEAELAVEIGPLTGERTETFYLERLRWPSDIDGVYLSRRTNAVTVETDGTPLVAETDYRLMAGYILDLIDTGWQGDKLAVTYTPTDTVLVREVIYDLLTFRSLPSNLQSVRIGQYSETYFPGASSPVWGAAIAKVLPASGMGLTSPFRMRRTSLHRTLITETP